MKPLKLMIADDYPIFREGLCYMLQDREHFEVVPAGISTDLMQQVEKEPPDVLLIDIGITEKRGGKVIREIKRIFPQTRVIALSMSQEDHLILEALKAGATGYLLKNATVETIITAAKAVHAGGFYFCNGTALHLFEKISSGIGTAQQYGKAKFTTREIEVMQLICREFSSKQIADRLHLSPRTVENMREKIMEKTGAVNMAGIVVFAMKNGIYKEEEK